MKILIIASWQVIKHSKPDFFKRNTRASSALWPSNSYFSEKNDDRNMPFARPRVDNKSRHKSRHFSITSKIAKVYIVLHLRTVH